MTPWKEKREIGNATLYLGDCLEILPHLEKVDAVITDPPYSEKTHSGAMTNKVARDNEVIRHSNKYRLGGAKLIGFDFWTIADFDRFCRCSLGRCNRWVIMTCDFIFAAHVLDWPECVRQGIYLKHAPMPQISGDRPGQGHEAVICLHNSGKKRWNGGGRPAVWGATVLKDPSVVKVASQKPQEFTDQLVRDFSDGGETVCDPCMGAGTVGVSALQMGRKFVGIELLSDHYEIACERIDQAQRQQRLFA